MPHGLRVWTGFGPRALERAGWQPQAPRTMLGVTFARGGNEEPRTNVGVWGMWTSAVSGAVHAQLGTVFQNASRKKMGFWRQRGEARVLGAGRGSGGVGGARAEPLTGSLRSEHFHIKCWGKGKKTAREPRS